jgi:hypothetical protein
MEDDRREPNPYSPPAAVLDAATNDAEVRYVIYRYAVSALVVTYYGHSEPIPVAINRTDWGKALLYSLLSLLFGWWGLPWGPIRTLQSIFINLTGGQDVTGPRSGYLQPNRTVVRIEDPTATWKCPQCNRYNSNRSFGCGNCGYRLV